MLDPVVDLSTAGVGTAAIVRILWPLLSGKTGKAHSNGYLREATFDARMTLFENRFEGIMREQSDALRATLREYADDQNTDLRDALTSMVNKLELVMLKELRK